MQNVLPSLSILFNSKWFYISEFFNLFTISIEVEGVFTFLWLWTYHEEEEGCGGEIRDDINLGVLKEVFIKLLFKKLVAIFYKKKI